MQADAWMRDGDPRGELFALQVHDPELAAKYLRDHHAAIYGDLAPVVRPDRIAIAWEPGRAATWTIHDLRGELDWAAVARHPLARDIQNLEVTNPDATAGDRQRACGALVRAVAPQLRRLWWAWGSRVEDFAALVGELPALEDLVCGAPGALGALRAPRLAALRASNLDLSAIERAHLPALARLDGLNLANADGLVAALARWPGLAHLRTLAVQHSPMSARALDTLAAHAGRFAHLERCSFPMCGLDRARVRDLRDAIPALQIEPMSLGGG